MERVAHYSRWEWRCFKESFSNQRNLRLGLLPTWVFPLISDYSKHPAVQPLPPGSPNAAKPFSQTAAPNRKASYVINPPRNRRLQSLSTRPFPPEAPFPRILGRPSQPRKSRPSLSATRRALSLPGPRRARAGRGRGPPWPQGGRYATPNNLRAWGRRREALKPSLPDTSAHMRPARKR